MSLPIKNIPLIICSAFFIFSSCSKSKNDGSSGGGNPPPPPPPAGSTPGINYWITSGDRSNLFRKELTASGFSTTTNNLANLNVDSTVQYQAIDGFGYTYTEGSAHAISQMPVASKATLFNELFGSAESSINVNFLRLGIGATDLSTSVYSYDDMPSGQTDPTLANFTLAKDQVVLIPQLKEVKAINPSVKFLSTPWSPPVWMKDNNSSIGGNLQPQYYQVYANYFVKYLQAMQSEGLPVYAITPQNEPLHAGNNPSLHMTAQEQANFIKNNLGPAINTAALQTKIIIYDHNADRPDYPLAILADAGARQYVDGSAFHLYGGDISALSTVKAAYPDKNIYFTEQYTASNGNFGGDLVWHTKNVVIGSLRNHSRVVLEWNLANDPGFGPFTPGGCNTCLGAITASNTGYTRNVAYYIIAQVSKFVPAGSKRIASDNLGSVQSVAFLRPDGKKTLLVLNESASANSFNIKFNGKWMPVSLPANSVATYVW